MVATIIDILARVLNVIIIVDVVLSYFMSPYQPVREFLDRFVEPLLSPIRRIIPPIQMIDFSPFILLILIEIVRIVLVSVLK